LVTSEHVVSDKNASLADRIFNCHRLFRKPFLWQN